MIKTWEVHFHILYDAQSHKKIIIKAHTEKKAIKLATEKLKKNESTDCIQFEYCKLMAQ